MADAVNSGEQAARLVRNQDKGPAFLTPKAPSRSRACLPGQVVSYDPPPGDFGCPRVRQDFERPVDTKFMRPDSGQQAAQVGSG